MQYYNIMNFNLSVNCRNVINNSLRAQLLNRSMIELNIELVPQNTTIFRELVANNYVHCMLDLCTKN